MTMQVGYATQATGNVSPWAMAASAPSRGPGGYEFTAAENEVIRRCGSRTAVWGWICGVGGALSLALGALVAVAGVLTDQLLNAIVAGGTYGAMGIINIAIAVCFIGAGGRFGRIVRTQGSDVPLLMEALGGLSRAYLIQIVATCVAVLLYVALIAVVFVAAMAAHAR